MLTSIAMLSALLLGGCGPNACECAPRPPAVRVDVQAGCHVAVEAAIERHGRHERCRERCRIFTRSGRR